MSIFVEVSNLTFITHRLFLSNMYNLTLFPADACFKTALSITPELAQNEAFYDETFVVSFVRSFLSVLLVVPDSPDRGVLNLVRMLLNTLQTFPWAKNSEALYSLYLNVLDLLSTMAQESYPYHVYKGTQASRKCKVNFPLS